MPKQGLLRYIKDYLKRFFDLSNSLDDMELAERSIRDGVSFSGPNIVILIIAIFIASLGLNTNSAAVIIGAMLISPLMGPILGIGFGVGTYDFDLIKRSFRNLAMAAGFSVLASTLYFLISPISEGRSEILARTSPTVYDVFIGFFGGAAGIVAVACKQKGNVLPGVAIATALMPPLCTAGYGLATGQMNYFFGAFYLFLINSIFIAFATTVGVKVFKFKQHSFIDEKVRKRVKASVYVILVVTLLPSIWLTFLMVHESYFVSEANKFITEQFVFPNTQVLNKESGVEKGKKYINVTLIGEDVNTDSLKKRMLVEMSKSKVLSGTTLNIRQGFGIESRQNNEGASELDKLSPNLINQIYLDSKEQNRQIDSLNRIVKLHKDFENLSAVLAPEIKVLFPMVSDMALSRNVFSNMNTNKMDTVNLAIVRLSKPMSREDQNKLINFLEVRSNVKPIRLINSRDISLQ